MISSLKERFGEFFSTDVAFSKRKNGCRFMPHPLSLIKIPDFLLH
jgi:hypothetical protein